RGVEVALAFPRPAGLEGGNPFGVGGPVAALVDIGRGALEDVEVLGRSGDVRNDLDPAGAGADHRDLLAGQSVQAALHGAAGVGVVPARAVEGVATELADTGDAGQFRLVERALGHDDESGADVVAAVGADPPALAVLVPGQRVDQGGEEGALVEVVVLADALGVLEALGAAGVLLLWHIAGFLEQRQIGVAVGVALDAGVAVPIPGAAEIAREFDDPEVGDARFLEP